MESIQLLINSIKRLMSTNKNADIRYQALDKCFRDRRHRYYIDDLIDACEKELEYYNGTGLNVYQYSDAYYNLANLYKDFAKCNEAIKYYNNSIEIIEDNECFCNLGVCYYNILDDIKTLECFEKALELNPNDYISLFNKGNALHNLGRYEDAEECYKMAETLRDDMDMLEPYF